MTLQLQVEEESFGCDPDYPPGFEEKNMTADIPSVSSSKDRTAELSTEVVSFFMLLFFLSICSGCVSYRLTCDFAVASGARIFWL